MTPNEHLFDDFTHRAVDVFAVGYTEGSQLADDFANAEDERFMAELVALLLSRAPNSTITQRDIDRLFSTRRDGFSNLTLKLERVIDRLTVDEGEFVSETVGPVQYETRDDNLWSTIFIATLFDKVMSRPVDGVLPPALLSGLRDSDQQRLSAVLLKAMTGNWGVKRTTTAVRHEFERSRKAIIGVTHLMVQHVRSTVLDFAMASIGESVRWVSILDGRTSAMCRSRSGKIYPAGTGPRPPAHWSCRSTVVPHLAGRGEFNEPTYDDWLRRQSPDRVREILGQWKGDAFLEGSLSLDDLVSDTGRELTIKELIGKRRRN